MVKAIDKANPGLKTDPAPAGFQKFELSISSAWNRLEQRLLMTTTVIEKGMDTPAMQQREFANLVDATGMFNGERAAFKEGLEYREYDRLARQTAELRGKIAVLEDRLRSLQAQHTEAIRTGGNPDGLERELLAARSERDKLQLREPVLAKLAGEAKEISDLAWARVRFAAAKEKQQAVAEQQRQLHAELLASLPEKLKQYAYTQALLSMLTRPDFLPGIRLD